MQERLAGIGLRIVDRAYASAHSANIRAIYERTGNIDQIRKDEFNEESPFERVVNRFSLYETPKTLRGVTEVLDQSLYNYNSLQLLKSDPASAAYVHAITKEIIAEYLGITDTQPQIEAQIQNAQQHYEFLQTLSKPLLKLADLPENRDHIGDYLQDYIPQMEHGPIDNLLTQYPQAEERFPDLRSCLPLIEYLLVYPDITDGLHIASDSNITLFRIFTFQSRGDGSSEWYEQYRGQETADIINLMRRKRREIKVISGGIISRVGRSLIVGRDGKDKRLLTP